ncbi:MAG: hypothetical protein FJZ94_03380 [Chloroflexi bacterium]|nr:hypothetical protein [Chloroflexota bacterium]
MSKSEKHHILPKETQRKYSIKYPFNKGVYDETTVSLDADFHDDITSQIRHQGKYRDLPSGVPVAYTVGEIERKLMEEAWED